MRRRSVQKDKKEKKRSEEVISVRRRMNYERTATNGEEMHIK